METNIKLTLTDEQSDILKLAIRHYGWESQLRQTQEEAAELIAAISHYLRTDRPERTLTAVNEEMADLLIMLHQISLYIPEHELTKAITVKIDRQRDRLKDSIQARYGHLDIPTILKIKENGND